MTQRFNTIDVLRLEVEDDPTGLVNMVQNPSGELGGWGWSTPVAGSALKQAVDGSGNPMLRYTAGTGPDYFYTEPMVVAAGQYVAASWVAPPGVPGPTYRVKIEWLDSSRAVLSSTTQTGYLSYSSSTVFYGSFLAPASTAYCRLRFDVFSDGSGGDPTAGLAYLYLREVTVAKAATSAALSTTRTNLIPNPSFETNVTGWAGTSLGTPSRSTAQAYVGSASLALTSVEGGLSMTVGTPSGTAGIPVEGGATYVAQIRSRAATTPRNVRVGLFYYDAAGASLGGLYEAGVVNTTSGWTHRWVTVTAPSSAAYARVIVFVTGPVDIGEVHYIDAVMLEKSTSPGVYFDGATPDAGSVDYAWTGTAHASASTATTSNLTYLDPTPYLNVLGPTHQIKVVRETLNVGTLEATILDATLDPAQSDLIRPGRRVRLLALDSSTSQWLPLFTGKMGEASVTYPKDPGIPDQKRARIQITAADGLAELANQKRAEGVASIDELPYVLEGCGVPWNVNGSGDQVSSAVVVAVNDNASAVDQVAITRDSSLGYAWLDRYGVVQVWDPTAITATTSAGFDETVVTDYDVSFNTQDCINEVTIRFLRLNPDTGETEEIPYGPYRNETSIAEWGVRSAEFTVQGLSEETTEIPDLAAAILAANSDPVVRVNGVTMAVTDEGHLTTDYALVDVMALALVEKSLDAPTFADDSFVQRVEHTITPDKWILAVGFLHEDVVASPQFTPSPTTGAGGKTIGQILRPVGEVTMWYGAAASSSVVTTNRVTNPSYETTEDWAAVSGSTEPARSTDRAWLGTYSVKFARGAGTGAPLGRRSNLTATLGAAGTYRVSARVWVDPVITGSAGIRISGTGVGATQNAYTPTRSGWAEVSITFTWDGTGTALLDVVDASITAGALIYLDGLMITAGSTAVEYFDGDTPDTETATHTTVYAWTGTPYASMSTKTVTTKPTIPAGWLLCDGAAFSASEYPELAALLGSTNTPNMVDVFPIGAGTKALGTNGGSPTKTITRPNLPRSDNAGTNAARVPRGDGTNTLDAEPLDVMPPWRALHFIIRAR